jgi:hypothetical protein
MLSGDQKASPHQSRFACNGWCGALVLVICSVIASRLPIKFALLCPVLLFIGLVIFFRAFKKPISLSDTPDSDNFTWSYFQRFAWFYLPFIIFKAIDVATLQRSKLSFYSLIYALFFGLACLYIIVQASHYKWRRALSLLAPTIMLPFIYNICLPYIFLPFFYFHILFTPINPGSPSPRFYWELNYHSDEYIIYDKSNKIVSVSDIGEGGCRRISKLIGYFYKEYDGPC